MLLPFRRQVKIPRFVVIAHDPAAAESGLDVGVLELREVTGKFHL
jgi:hypothetical protein